MPIIIETRSVEEVDEYYDNVISQRRIQNGDIGDHENDADSYADYYNEENNTVLHSNNLRFSDDDTDSCISHGISLPTAEQIRQSISIRQTKWKSSSSFQKWYQYFTTNARGRFIFLVIVAIAFVTSIVTFISVGVSHNSNNGKTQPSAQSIPRNGNNGTPFDSTRQANRNTDYGTVAVYLIENNISKAEDLYSPDTFQYQAAHWIANIDGANLVVPITETKFQERGYMYIARYIMALNYFAMNGPGWQSKNNFLSSDHICTWNEKQNPNAKHYEVIPGVYTDFVFQWGVNCTDNIPTTFTLDGNNLFGTIPFENGHLLTLKKFNLRKNTLAGELPTSLCQITGLVDMDVSSNQLSGTIPECLGEMTRLQSINLSRNRLIGPIPDEVGLLHERLENLILSDNGLSGQPAPNVFNKLTNLRNLLVSNNGFDGIIDKKFLSSSMQLQKIDISNNRFTSHASIPSHFFNAMPQLVVLDMSKNRLRGSIPTDLVSNTKLSYLSLYDNMLTGTITKQIENLDVLEHLDLSKNQLIGDIPAELGDMFTLRYLNLGQNPLLTDAPVPTNFVLLMNLRYLSLRETNRIGRMPPRINKLRNLLYLDLSHNKFTGALPLSYYVMSDLQVLMLNSNNVSGVIPETIGSWSNLHAALFDGTDLTGSLDVLCPFITSVKHEVIYADCGGAVPKVNCTCCQCCQPAVTGINGCSREKVIQLDRAFESTYQLSDYSIDISTVMNPDFQGQLCLQEGICN